MQHLWFPDRIHCKPRSVAILFSALGALLIMEPIIGREVHLRRRFVVRARQCHFVSPNGTPCGYGKISRYLRLLNNLKKTSGREILFERHIC
jgi:hypothetical protein